MREFSFEFVLNSRKFLFEFIFKIFSKILEFSPEFPLNLPEFTFKFTKKLHFSQTFPFMKFVD